MIAEISYRPVTVTSGVGSSMEGFLIIGVTTACLCEAGKLDKSNDLIIE